MKILCFTLWFAFAGLATASAQSIVGPGALLAWDQNNVDVVVAQRYQYVLLIDSVRQQPLDGVLCVHVGLPGVTGGTSCAAPVPALTPNLHELRLKATDGPGQESEWSETLTIAVRVFPATPAQFRLTTPQQQNGPNP